MPADAGMTSNAARRDFADIRSYVVLGLSSQKVLDFGGRLLP